MEYTRLGKSGLKVSKICLGAMSFGEPKTPGQHQYHEWAMGREDALKIVEAAWKGGINFFDTADFYTNGDSERILGWCLKKLGIPREEVVIATKVFFAISRHARDGEKDLQSKPIRVNAQGLSRKHIFDAVEGSLERLGTSYIDLYQIHRWDNTTPIEETMKALHDLVQSGKVRYIGASTMFAWQFITAQEVARKNGWTEFVSMQNFYNVAYREEEREMNRYCAETGVGLIPWSPLAGGFLARAPSDAETKRSAHLKGQADSWFTESTHKIRDVVGKIAKERKVSQSEVAIAWVLHMEGVTAPIVGVTKLSHLEPALKAVKLKLTDKEIDELNAPYQANSIQGFFPNPSFGRRARAKL